MVSFAERLVREVGAAPGRTDRELTDALRGRHAHPAQVNQEARLLEGRRLLVRRRRDDGRIGNYPAAPTGDAPAEARAAAPATPGGMSEDELKAHLEAWLSSEGWSAQIAWGKSRGVDIVAERQGRRWLIEVKGHGSLQPMRVNYFLAILGETLQRMDDPRAKYSIALPDVPQFRRLWERLPRLAKQRTKIGALFVGGTGKVAEDAPAAD